MVRTSSFVAQLATLVCSTTLFAQTTVGDISVVATVVSNPTTQLSQELTARVGVLSGTVIQSLPVGTVVTGGARVAATSPVGERSGTAEVAFTTTTSPTTIGGSLTSSATTGSVFVGPLGWVSAAATGRIELLFTAPDPVPVWIDVVVAAAGYQCGAGCASRESIVTVAGHGDVTCPADCGGPFVFPPPCTTTLAGVVDAGGLRVLLTTRAISAGDSGRCVGATSISSNCSVTLRRREGGEAYGVECGATLRSVPNAALVAAETFEVADTSLPSAIGILWLGTQQVSFTLPPWTCPIQTDPIVAIPIGLTGGSLRFTAPRLPPAGGLTMQAVTYSGSTLHTSNGLQL